MKHIELIIFLGTVLSLSALHGQGLEELWEAAGDDPSLRTHFETLRDNPIDLNTADAQRLQETLFLDPALVNNVIQYRNRHYPLTSTDDILNVPGMSPDLYRFLKPYITVTPTPPAPGLQAKLVSRIYRRYPHSRGYSEQIYRGDPLGASHAITLTRGNISCGSLIHKDPGETRWNDHQAIFVRADQILGPHDRWILGTYRLGFGQGLVLSNGFRLSSTSADPMAILPRQPLGVRQFASTSEFQYFQGAAVQNQYRNLAFALFLSRIFRDASLEDDGGVKTIQTTGLHRTTSEDANRQQLREDLYGGHLEYSGDAGSAGLTAYQVQYQPHLSPADPETQHFDFVGSNNSVIGINAAYRLGAVQLSGEIARSKSGGQAFLIDGKINIASAQTSAIYRRYDPDFHNMYAVTLTEWGHEANNEEGWLLAMKTPLWQGATFASRADITTTPWRTYSFPLTRHGSGVVMSLEQSLGKQHTLFARLRASQVEDIESGAIIRQTRLSTRCQWDWEENRSRSYRLRWERVDFDTPAASESGIGWMAYGQLTVTDQRALTAKFRLAAFDIPVWGARIYAYEDDLPGRMVSHLFSGTGRRLSTRVKWSAFPSWNLWLKAAATAYDGVTSIGSGWDQIPSHLSYDLGIALEWKTSASKL
jgi:hypothetical protein